MMEENTEQGCCEGVRVPDYQEHVEDEVQNKPNVIKVTFKVIFSIKCDGKEEDLCVSDNRS